jgi:hypothetical protein
MISRDFEFSAIQQYHYRLASIEYADNSYIIDLSKLLKLDVDGLKKEFYISLKKGVTPKSCVGGEIELYEEKRDFNTYKIIYTSEKITITI